MFFCDHKNKLCQWKILKSVSQIICFGLSYNFYTRFFFMYIVIQPGDVQVARYGMDFIRAI